MQIFACWDGDHIGREVGRAVMSDDVAGVRRVDQAITLGNELWRSFALKFDGTVIEIAGEAGRIEFEAKHLTELPAVAEQYAKAVGATISVGVGMKLSDSARALLVAKRRGGNQVVLWHPDMAQELEAAEPKEAGIPLGKTAPSEPSAPKRVRNQGDHEQGAVAAQFVEDHPSPVGATASSETRGADGRFSASTTPKAAQGPGEDVEGGLHGEASKQKATDDKSAQQNDAAKEQLRAQLVKVLQLVKTKVQVISQLQQVDPEAFQAVMGLVQGVVALGRQTVGEVDVPDQQQPVQKAEKQDEDLAKMALIHDDPGKPTTVYRMQNAAGKGPYDIHNGPIHSLALRNGRPMKEPAENPQPSPGSDFVPDELKDFNGTVHPGVLGRANDSKFQFAFEHPDHAEQWFGPENIEKMKGIGYSLTPVLASKVYRSQTGKQVFYLPHNNMPKTEDDYSGSPATPTGELEKDGSPIARQPAYASVTEDLPIGTDLNGRTKAQHGDGTVSWPEVKAGKVQSKDGGANSQGSAVGTGRTTHEVSSRQSGGR